MRLALRQTHLYRFVNMAEMERFELSRRFEPTYRISSADPSTAWVHLRIFPPVFNSQNLLERKAGEKT